MGYLDILNFTILAPKGQGPIQSLTSDILVITWNFLMKLIYLYSL